jgi:hypothetical protein
MSDAMTTEKPDAVRENTADDVNARLDEDARRRVEAMRGRPAPELVDRIDQLRREWDMERYLEVNAAAIAGAGVLLAALHDRRWLVVPGIVLPFLLMHAVQGWCPPVPVFRRYGVRTRQEIDREIYALKAMRGDFRPGSAEWEAARV